MKTLLSQARAVQRKWTKSSFFGLLSIGALLISLPQPCRSQSTAAASQSPSANAGFSYNFALGGNVAQATVEITDSLIFIPVSVNGGAPSWFLLDSERANSAVDDLRAAALGLSVSSPAAGSVKAVSNAVLEIPGLKLTLPSLQVESLSDWSSHVGRNIQGILGEDVLSHFVVVLNYQRQMVQFYEPRSFQYSGHGDKLILQMAGGVPAVQAKVDVHGRGTLRGLFPIATAQTIALEFSPSFAAAHDFSSLSQKTIPYFAPEGSSGSETSDAQLGRVHQIQIDKFSLPDPLAVIPGAATGAKSGNPSRKNQGDSVAASIGGGILRRFTVVLDSPHQALYLEPNYDFPDLFTADMSGLDLLGLPPDFHIIEVGAVSKDSPAASAGILPGDILEAVDGQTAAAYSLDDVRSLLRELDSEHHLTFNRGGKTIEVTLKLKPLI